VTVLSFTQCAFGGRPVLVGVASESVSQEASKYEMPRPKRAMTSDKHNSWGVIYGVSAPRGMNTE